MSDESVVTVVNPETGQFLKFLVVGGINTLFGYGVYSLLLFVGVHYVTASFISTVLGVLFNFRTTGTIVFRNSDNGLIFRFIGMYVVTFLINVSCLKVFDFLKVNMFLAGGILILPSALIAFLLNRGFVFIKDRDETSKSYY